MQVRNRTVLPQILTRPRFAIFLWRAFRIGTMTAPYITSGENGPAGYRASYSRPCPIEAVWTARSMLEEVFNPVRIIDAEGRIYHKINFDLLPPPQEQKIA